MRILEDLFNSVSIINVSDLLVEAYIMIDAFSQRNCIIQCMLLTHLIRQETWAKMIYG